MEDRLQPAPALEPDGVMKLWTAIAAFLVLVQAGALTAREPRYSFSRPLPRYPFRAARRPTFRESPFHRERRVLSSPSLYAGPYPGGGLYAWRQSYYERLRYPLFDRSHDHQFLLFPYSRELTVSQLSEPREMFSGLGVRAETDDPVTTLQRKFFTDDLHSAEDLLQIRLGY